MLLYTIFITYMYIYNGGGLIFCEPNLIYLIEFSIHYRIQNRVGICLAFWVGNQPGKNILYHARRRR